MVPVRPFLLAAFLALLALSAPAVVIAEPGMWTLDHPPAELLTERYGFTPTAEWLERVQRGAVKFTGGSGSFVSPDGLVLTNHHVALNQLHKMSSPEHDYVRDGFFARTRAEEIPCPDLELRVLESYENVTARVLAAVDGKAPLEQQAAQRRAATARIEEEGRKATGLKCEVVELYRGGEYWLYRYRNYTEIRLVMAPEEQFANFGGDPDNFGFPRHDLDMAVFRVYEQGQPVHPKSWFRVSAAGPSEGELGFVPGHPGATMRSRTVAQLEYERDLWRPARIALQERRLAAIRDYAARGAEERRRALDRDRALENNLKRERAFLELLQAGSLLERKRVDEAALRSRVARDPRLAEARGAWDRIAAAQREMRARAKQWVYRDFARGPRLPDIAESLVRYAIETAKPDEQRFREYREGNLASQRFRLLSRAPLFPDLDAVLLAAQLEAARAELGASDPWVRAALGGREPADVARALLEGTTLADVEVRRSLVEGGAAAVAASTDPLIVWARTLEPLSQELRRWREQRVESVESLEGGRIARALFALDGRNHAPDATGTLRLSLGKVAGYPQLTSQVPWRTTWYGLFDRTHAFEGRPPFDLPERVHQARGKLDLAGPLNFVSDADIIGGSSGSPVLNRDLALVGLVFDSNLQALGWEFEYDDTAGRSVSVASPAILESLRKIYDMPALADEMEGVVRTEKAAAPRKQRRR